MVARMMVLMKMMMMVVTIWWSSDGAIQNSSRCSRTFFPFIWPFKAAKLLVPLLFVGLISVSSATFWKPTQPSIKALKGLWKRFQPLWSVSGKTNWKLLSRNFGAKATPCNCKCKIWLCTKKSCFHIWVVLPRTGKMGNICHNFFFWIFTVAKRFDFLKFRQLFWRDFVR